MVEDTTPNSLLDLQRMGFCRRKVPVGGPAAYAVQLSPEYDRCVAEVRPASGGVSRIRTIGSAELRDSARRALAGWTRLAVNGVVTVEQDQCPRQKLRYRVKARSKVGS